MSGHRAPTGFETPNAANVTEFWMVRHAETEWNAVGRYQGQADVALSQAGREQAARLAGRLAGLSFAAVYASDLARALETAQTVARTLNGAPEVRPDAGLREIDVGRLSGKLRAEIEAEFPDYLRELREDPWNARRPGGESMADLAARVERSFVALEERHRGERVLVVTHGGVVRVAVALAIGGADKDVWARLSVANTSITRVTLGAASQLLSFNDVAHLERVSRALARDDVREARS